MGDGLDRAAFPHRWSWEDRKTAVYKKALNGDLPARCRRGSQTFFLTLAAVSASQPDQGGP